VTACVACDSGGPNNLEEEEEVEPVFAAVPLLRL